MRSKSTVKETKALLNRFAKGATSKEIAGMLKIPHTRILNVSKRFQSNPYLNFGVPKETTYEQRLPTGGIVIRKAEKLDVHQSSLIVSELDRETMGKICNEMYARGEKRAVVMEHHSFWMHLYMLAQFNVYQPIQRFGSPQNEEDHKETFKLKHAVEDGLLSESLFNSIMLGKKRLTDAQKSKVQKIIDEQEDVVMAVVKVNGRRKVRGIRVSRLQRLLMQARQSQN